MTKTITIEEAEDLERYVKDQWPSQLQYNRMMALVAKLKAVACVSVPTPVSIPAEQEDPASYRTWEKEELIAALISERAAAPIALPAQTPDLRVKPLVWRRGYRDEGVEISQATSMGGVFQIRKLDAGVWLDKPDGRVVEFPTAEEAMEAAQADHRRLILECVENSPGKACGTASRS